MGHRQLASRIRQLIRAADPNNHDELYELLDEMKDHIERILECSRYPTETTVHHGYGSRGQSCPSSPFVVSDAGENENNSSFVFSDVGEVVFSDMDGPTSPDPESSESEYGYESPASTEILYERIGSDEDDSEDDDDDVQFVAPYAAML